MVIKDQLVGLADELEREQATLQRELDEIELLLRQTQAEAERHEQRRVQAEERSAALERDPAADPTARAEAHLEHVSQTGRATLMQAQLDVLSGKQRALIRFQERVTAALPIIREAAQAAGGVESPAMAEASNAGVRHESSDVLAAQEQMRGEIARQMHDGPAQSIANIALQAQIVEHLYERDPARAQAELGELVNMVQQALEATKSFIFDIRPMVLDDLGLVPTLRRSAREQSRRSNVEVRFESIGSDRRLGTDLEGALFRIVDDAVGGYLEVSPMSVLVRLEWTEQALRAIVRARPAGGDDSAEAAARKAVAAARRDRQLPAALATMIREQEEDEARHNAGLPAAARSNVEQRAAAFGIAVSISDDGWQVGATVGAGS